mgnify:CR=1 FL=1
MCSFVQDENLILADSLDISLVDYSYESKVNFDRSAIDHFIFSDKLADCITEYSVRHDGDNLSDHDPVVLKLNIPIEYANNERDRSSIPRPLWHQATKINLAQYGCVLDIKLRGIVIPWQALHCKNTFCSKHSHDIQKFHDDIIAACLAASKEAIPYSVSKQKKVIPGWNEYVETHRREANFWHYLWKCNNSPRAGILCDIRNSTSLRAKYHYALRFVQKE